jgi:hypothetical protein
LFYFEFSVISVPFLSIEAVNLFELISFAMLVGTRVATVTYFVKNQGRSHVTLPVVMASRILWNTVTKQLQLDKFMEINTILQIQASYDCR